MAHYRAQIGFPFDTALPRDVVTVNPHYNGDDAQGLADRLKQNLIAGLPGGATVMFTVKVYNAEAPPPSYPLATASNGTNPAATAVPREIALCLSYYATWNRPGYRGRLYIPAHFIGGVPGLRPTVTQRNACLAWKTILTDGMPGGTIWELWSPTRGQGSGVSDVWVDDEWDTVRSRGMRPTTRTVGTVP